MDERRKNLSQAIAARLREALEISEKSADELAQAVGLTEQNFRRFLSGTVQLPASLLPMIAQEVGLPVWWFFRPATPEEERHQELLSVFEQLPPKHQKHVLALMRTMVPAMSKKETLQ